MLEMHRANHTFGAPRIHGELLKLGFTLAQSTVSKYLPRRQKPPSQSWRAFLRNHLAVVPTVTFRLLYVFVVLSLERRSLLHVNVTSHPTAAWSAQQMVEALPEETRSFIGSLRRECLDHLIVLNERQVCRILSVYARYYNCARTQLALEKDSPERRRVHGRQLGPVIAFPEVRGLHHRYERVAA